MANEKSGKNPQSDEKVPTNVPKKKWRLVGSPIEGFIHKITHEYEEGCICHKDESSSGAHRIKNIGPIRIVFNSKVSHQ